MTQINYTATQFHKGENCTPDDWRETLAAQMCEPFASVIRNTYKTPADATELRFRAGLRITARTGTREREISAAAVTPANLSELLSFLCNFSIYSKQEQLSQGFITLRGGFRAGIAGSFLQGEAGSVTIANISGINIRIARAVKGCAEGAAKSLFADGLHSTLIISPPGMGKTTLLRDIIRIISDKGARVSIADERGEIAAMFGGEHSMDVGRCTDVIDGCPKHTAMMMLLRSMTPDVIAVDEIGSEQDAQALAVAALSGVKTLATAHGDSVHGIRRNRNLLAAMEIFDKAVILGGAPGNVVSITNLRESAQKGRTPP